MQHFEETNAVFTCVNEVQSQVMSTQLLTSTCDRSLFQMWLLTKQKLYDYEWNKYVLILMKQHRICILYNITIHKHKYENAFKRHTFVYSDVFGIRTYNLINKLGGENVSLYVPPCSYMIVTFIFVMNVLYEHYL